MPDASTPASPNTAPAGGRPFLDDYMLYLLTRAAAETTTRFHAEIRRRGHSIAEWRVLFTLADGPLSVGDLAAMMFIQQPTLTKIIDRMEAGGLVAREPDPADRRRVRVSLTSKGKAENKVLIPLAQAHEDTAFGALTKSERIGLKKALRKLISG